MEKPQAASHEQAEKPPQGEAIFGLLDWLATVSVPIGATLLAIAALYWVEFIKLYALPVDFASSGTLSGLPALAAVIAALVGLLALSALMPMRALIYPFDSEGRTLIQAHQAAPKGETRPKRWGGSLAQRWITISIALVLLWPIVLVVTYYFPSTENSFLVVFAVALIAAYLFILPVQRQVSLGKRASLDFVLNFIGGIGTQLLLTFGVFFIAAKTLPDSSTLTMIVAFVICMLICAAISGVQLIAAKIIASGWPNRTLRLIVPIAILTMALPLIYPPLGGAIASYPFRVTSAGKGSCVTLASSDLSEKSAWTDITDKARTGHTLPLSFAVRLSDSYYVKLATDPTTYILPAAKVTEVGGCPKPARQQATVAAQRVEPLTATGHQHKSMALAALITSILSALAALLAVFFTVHLWRKSNRPFVTARIAMHSGGNVGIALDILVENAGNQPALDVRLKAKNEDVRSAMRAREGATIDMQRDAQRVFFSDVSIPVLSNGKTVSNAFGSLGDEAGEWHAGAQIPIEVSYRGMDGRGYAEKGVLLLHADDGFAQTSWMGPADREIGHRHVEVIERPAN